MIILTTLCIFELWGMLGLLSFLIFSYLNKQKIQITDISVILLALLYGPITYKIILSNYKA